MTPTARSMAHLRDQGYHVVKVEYWSHFAKRRVDFGGFADVLAWRGDVPGVLAVQATTDSNVSARIRKVLASSELRDRVTDWTLAGNQYQVWGWGLHGERGKRKVWTVRRLNETGEVLP